MRVVAPGGGIYLRGRTWWLDFTHDGRRHIVCRTERDYREEGVEQQ